MTENRSADQHPAQGADDVGIASIGLHLPPLSLDVRRLAELRGVDPDKYSIGLGCREIALCPPGFGVVDLAVEAARRALGRWQGTLDDIGLLVVGSESAVDMSRPLSAFVADRLGLRGAVRSYEVKHACYGGTLALRQAVEWKRSGASRGKAALVIAADVALYAPEDPGEPTQGAGAVAMIVDRASVAAVDVDSYAWSEPEFDFWRPVGESYPKVDGPLSLDCYKRAAERCFHQWVEERETTAVVERGSAAVAEHSSAEVAEHSSAEVIDEMAAWCFHVPFPKMVKKAALHVAQSFGWDDESAGDFYRSKVDGTMGWNRRMGNSYTASLWFSVAEALVGRREGDRIGAFSYGSGFGSELMGLTAGPEAGAGAWAEDMEQDLRARRPISSRQYAALRSGAPIDSEDAA